MIIARIIITSKSKLKSPKVETSRKYVTVFSSKSHIDGGSIVNLYSVFSQAYTDLVKNRVASIKKNKNR